MRWGRPPGLARAPCSRVRSWLDAVGADELVADGDLDGVADDGDLDLAAPIRRCRPGSWCRRSTRCLTSRPCGSPTPRSPTGRDGRGRRPRSSAGGLLVEGVAAGVGGDEHPTMVELHEPALADDLDGLAGQPRARPCSCDGREADRALGAHPPRRHRLAPARSSRARRLRPDSTLGAASLNRSIGGTRPIDWCGRSWL